MDDRTVSNLSKVPAVITANVSTFAVPIVIIYVIGWAVLKGTGEIFGAVIGKSTSG